MATKRQTADDPNSCWNKAKDDEEVFVLIERDDTFAGLVRDWAARRVAAGKNKPDDPEIVEALALATQVREKKVAARKAGEA